MAVRMKSETYQDGHRSVGGERPTEWLHVYLHAGHQGDVVLRSALTLPGLSPVRGPGRETPYVLALLDGSGRTLAETRVYDGRCCGPPSPELGISESLPWDEAARRLVLRRGATVVAAFPIAEAPPILTMEPVMHRGGSAPSFGLAWGHWGGTDVRYTLRYTPDEGRRWRVLLVDSKDTHLDVSLAHLPGSEAGYFEVVAMDGLRSARRRTESVRVPRKPLDASILLPRQGEILPVGEPLRLWAVGGTDGRGAVAEDGFAWSSDVSGSLVVGRELVIDRVRPGRHRLLLTVAHAGERRSETVSITVEG